VAGPVLFRVADERAMSTKRESSHDGVNHP
jgi:hypothetical protein